MEITQETFNEQRTPIFGRKNPERMEMPFWELMIRTGQYAYWARKQFHADKIHGSPVWCFDRFGMSQTDLPDGRIVYIAGEHEDYYDPDFYIYNDVIVVYPDKKIEIYGYPKGIFPPTDFHSATLVEGKIYIIGSLGYLGERIPGFTPVYALDTTSFQIKRLETTGESPGWIFRHQAELSESNTNITIRGGKLTMKGHETELTNNFWTYQFDLFSLRWKKISS